MDFTTKELLKRYAKLAIGQPFSPILLNILVTSVCDMRCTHCFFTDELDDRPRKKLQMKTHEIERISETLGGNLGVLILAGGESFTRKDLPEIARAFYTNNKLESIYIMSNGQIQKRIFPDVQRILTECHTLNVTVALGIDGPKTEHETHHVMRTLFRGPNGLEHLNRKVGDRIARLPGFDGFTALSDKLRPILLTLGVLMFETL